uniref:Uncharacterized protein n=1 Tax=Amphimedon queenslandica TaxID=400682 RepID=A0A1X7SI10_AMPQE
MNEGETLKERGREKVFAYSRGQDDLPLWLRPQLLKYNKFGPAQRDLTSFFKTAQNKYGHLVSIKNSLPDVKPDYTSGIVGGARGVVKLNPDAIFKDDDEIEDIDIEDYTTASLSKSETESGCDLLSSLKFDELHPVQPHHVAMAASRKREEEKRDEIPQTSQCLRSVGNSDSLPASKRKKIIIIDDKKSAATISSSERPSAQVFSEQLKSHLCKNSMSKFKRAFGDYNKSLWYIMHDSAAEG